MMDHEEETKLIPDNNTQQKQKYPKSVFFIIGNEFCERFSYYGMRAILVLYFVERLQWSNDLATGIYHTFIVLCYFMPVFGAILADGYIGKYKTIIYLSLVYAVRNIVMTFTAFPPPFWVGPMVGLVLIGFGTGGIKPCVAAFGGDQFSNEQEKERNQFFSIFYFSINLGSFLSMIITPLIKDGVNCFGGRCFSLAFAVPAILMLISLVLFWSGRSLYKIYPPTGSVIKNFFCCIGSAIKNRCRSGTGPKEHWLDYAGPQYETSFLEEVKSVLRVFVLFIPLPVFWALFDQQGSRWTIQSTQLDRKITENWYLLPEQIQAVNPILILLLIPFFEVVVYPLLDKCKVPNRPLQRMVIGMLLASSAFVVAGFLQLRINDAMVHLPSGNSNVRFINQSPCPLVINSAITNQTLPEYQESSTLRTASSYYPVIVEKESSCNLLAENQNSVTVDMQDQNSYYVVYALANSTTQTPQLKTGVFKYDFSKLATGDATVRVIYVGPTFSDIEHSYLHQTTGNQNWYSYNISNFAESNYIQVSPGRYAISMTVRGLPVETDTFYADNGAKYTVFLNQNGTKVRKVIPAIANYVTFTRDLETGGHVMVYFNLVVMEDIPADSVSIWAQFPQYILITIGEVVFSVTGVSFAYSQAPESMKSVVQAGWLMTTAFGNLIDVIVAGAQLIPNQAAEFFFFAALMAVTTLIFAIMSYFYRYVNTSGNYIDLDMPDSDTKNFAASPSPMAYENRAVDEN